MTIQHLRTVVVISLSLWLSTAFAEADFRLEDARAVTTKAIKTLGVKVQRARSCGYSEKQMEGAAALYNVTLELVEAVQASKMNDAEKKLSPTKQEITAAFLEGITSVQGGQPSTPEFCATLTAHWPESERKNNELAAKTRVGTKHFNYLNSK